MADNAVLKSDATATLFPVAADEVTYSSDAGAKLQLVRRVQVTGAEGSKIVVDGCSTYHKVSDATTNAAIIKAGPGKIFGARLFNTTNSVKAAKLHNGAGTPTAGIGVAQTFMVQAGEPLVQSFPEGIAFTAGIGITMVGGATAAAVALDTAATAVALGDLVVDFDFI